MYIGVLHSLTTTGVCKLTQGVHGIYKTLAEAQKGLVECKDVTYDEVVQNEDSETLEYAQQNTHVYGSVNDGYFEIDYDLGAGPCEIYIKITEQ